MLIVALSLIVFSELSMWIGFGRRVADVRVVYVILHTSRLPNELVNGVLLQDGPMCLQP